MKLPFFTLSNYQQIMQLPYAWVPAIWLDFWNVISVLRPGLIWRFANLDARKLWTDLNVPSSEKLRIWTEDYALKDAMIALKLLLPTLWACEYFFRNVKEWTHLGIDLLLPQWTPLPSFSAGKVTRIKTRDGTTKNEGNCVVVQDDRWHFRWYEHLETISVQQWQTVQQWTVLGTCWKTGNATQYHLHLQVDLPNSPWSHPYRSGNITEVKKYSCDPLAVLRAVSPNSSVKDLPYNSDYQECILILIHAWILKSQPQVRPLAFLQRYEMALIMHRMLKKHNRYQKLQKQTTTKPAYTDVTLWQAELDEALLWLRQYGIMKWSNGMFEPSAELKWEACLALLGRAFYGLQDVPAGSKRVWSSNELPRYQSYFDYFKSHTLIDNNRPFIGNSIPRQDIFLVVKDVLKNKGLI